MSYIKFINSDKKHNAIIRPIDLHTIEVVGADKNTSGVKMYLDNDMEVGNYENFKYSYLDVTTDTFQYSDDGSAYIEPEPIVIPEPIPPTEEELAEIATQNKIAVLCSSINILKSEIASYDYIFTKRQEIELIEDEIYKAEQLAQYELDYPSDILQPIIKLRVDKRAEINLLEEELKLL